MTYRISLGIAFALALVGCNKAGGQANRVTELCTKTTNMSAEQCRCIGDKAESDLSPAAREFLVASLEQQEQRAAELRGKLSIEEAMKAGMFMVNAPRACAEAAGTRPTQDAAP